MFCDCGFSWTSVYYFQNFPSFQSKQIIINNILNNTYKCQHLTRIYIMVQGISYLHPRKLHYCIGRDFIKPSLWFSYLCVFFVSKGYLLEFYYVLL